MIGFFLCLFKYFYAYIWVHVSLMIFFGRWKILSIFIHKSFFDLGNVVSIRSLLLLLKCLFLLAINQIQNLWMLGLLVLPFITIISLLLFFCTFWFTFLMSQSFNNYFSYRSSWYYWLFNFLTKFQHAFPSPSLFHPDDLSCLYFTYSWLCHFEQKGTLPYRRK